MLSLSPLAIKAAIIGAIVLSIVGGYFAWKHHVQTVEREKVMRQMAESSAKLLQQKLKEVKKENDEFQERKDNAIQAYAEHSGNIQRDIDNLNRRLRNTKANSCRDTLPREISNAPVRERQDQSDDKRIAETVIKLVNSCEFWINQIPVSE